MGRAGRRKYTDILDHCDSSDDHNDTVGFVGVVGKLGVLCGVGDFTYGKWCIGWKVYNGS